MPPHVMQDARIAIDSDRAIVDARQQGRQLSSHLGFGPVDQTLVATAISELARNILLYAARGDITVSVLEENARLGVMVVASDEGPGIANVQRALQDEFSTSGGLGLGLPGVRRLMDEFLIESAVGHGTTVTVRKWRA